MTAIKRFWVFALALAVVFPAMAQFKIGPRVGLNVNSLHFNESTFDKENRAGFTGGVQAEFTVPIVGIGFDASVMYVKRTSEWMESQGLTSTTNKIHSDYIEVPINVKYKFGIPVVGSFFAPYLFTGPSFAFRASKDIVADYQARKTDVAWNVGLGFEFLNHLQLSASYGFGLNKALEYVGTDVTSAGIDGKNRYWTVTLAYLF